MFIDFLLEGFKKAANSDALIWRDRVFNYDWLIRQIDSWIRRLEQESLFSGQVVGISADFSPNSVALLLALIERGCIVIPLTSAVASKRDELLAIAQCENLAIIDKADKTDVISFNRKADHPLYKELRRRAHPGLVLFTSGSTGQSKAVLHDFVEILQKFKTPRHRMRAISFLLYDHIGGVNTLLYQLSNAGCVITLHDHSPEAVLSTVEKYQAELLPASPTFLSLLLLSEAHRRYDSSSLKVVTYGTEPMQEDLLKRLCEIFPTIRFQQTYGLSELGILRSKSKSSDSLWVKIGGEGFETRVVDGQLQIKAQSAMLGYLNAPSPFTEDGWFITGDAVEVDGDYFRILGRQSEIINVGGQKVYPAEVEAVLERFEGVKEARVYGKKNPIMGQIVCAELRLKDAKNEGKVFDGLKRFCREHLEDYKIPIKIQLVDHPLHNQRFKKIRRPEHQPS